MDETPLISGKKQRSMDYNRKQRQKNQKDKRKHHETQSETARPVATASNVSDPQPQRTNRRQCNEALTTSANNAASSITPDNADVKVITEKENVTIDFSNLKRETEEITKLTKKFEKRNISSNWHRYSAPEGADGHDEKTEEEAPADFSALIQVPASSPQISKAITCRGKKHMTSKDKNLFVHKARHLLQGGHLQLKDEQEWSTASSEQLGGYFALNLKLLSQSLACIPLYEQLRLPKHMFTEEELKHFDNLASEARQIYNPDNVEDPNELVKKAITNLLQREIDAIEDTDTKKNINTSYNIDILNDHGNNQKLLTIDLQPEIISDNSPRGIYNLSMNDKVSVENDKSSFSILNKEDEDSVQTNKKHLEKNISLERSGKDDISLLSNLTEISESEKVQNSQSHKVSKRNDDTDETGIFTEAAKEISVNTTKEIPQTNKIDPESIIIDEPKDKRSKNNRKTPLKDIGERKLNNIEDTLKLEDDDDLDFLLSLKKPVLPENKKLNSVPDKDSTDQLGRRKTPQVPPVQQHSELDDWLDSVLQD